MHTSLRRDLADYKTDTEGQLNTLSEENRALRLAKVDKDEYMLSAQRKMGVAKFKYQAEVRKEELETSFFCCCSDG